jgi:hypothetical protein
MPSSLRVGDVREAIQARLFPTVTTLNRLEARPRTVSLDRALRAEVRDPLWMLTKQWQMGEFRGSDAGSPVFAKLQIDTTRLTKYRPADLATQPFEHDVPLEAMVERRRIPLTAGGRPASLDLRMVMGRQWLTMISGIGAYRQAFIQAYPIPAADPANPQDADRCAQPEVWQLFAAAAGRMMDGGALYSYLVADPAHHAYDGIAGVAPADKELIDVQAAGYVAWFERWLLQPTAGDDAWIPPRLEYQFAASAPLPSSQDAEKVYVASQYYQGRLDWYSVDVDPGITLDAVPGSAVTGLPPAAPQTMIPVPVSFSGMPNTRWWAFEDSKTNFGDIDASTTDLAKLMFIEFALVYSNDWFVIPYTLPSGAIATVSGFVVQNTFGERFWINAAGSGADDGWQRWSMFTVDILGAGGTAAAGGAGSPADTSLVLMPTVSKVQQGPLAEDVWLVRDEVANMVWGIEKSVPLASGDSKPGLETARQTLAFYQGLVQAPGPSPLPATDASLRYQVMTTVPENWIPFIPVHVDGDNREIQLQRAALPRILEGDPNPPASVQPRTMLLRQGLDDDPPEPYFVHEEEVPRAGTRAVQAYQRTRWTDGQVYTWLRVIRQTGRGEGSSGLAFDQAVPTPPANALAET